MYSSRMRRLASLVLCARHARHAYSGLGTPHEAPAHGQSKSSGLKVALDHDALAGGHEIEVLVVPHTRAGRVGHDVAGLVGPAIAVVAGLPHVRHVLAAADCAGVGAVQHERLARPRERAVERGAVLEERRARGELGP